MCSVITFYKKIKGFINVKCILTDYLGLVCKSWNQLYEVVFHKNLCMVLRVQQYEEPQ